MPVVIVRAGARHYVAGWLIVAVVLFFLSASLGDAKAMGRWLRYVMPFGLAAGASLAMLKLRPGLGVRMMRWTVMLTVAMPAVAVVIGLVLLLIVSIMPRPSLW